MGIKNAFEWLRKTPEAGAVFFAAAVSFVVHSLPFILYGTHPLGYDTGFYRRYLIEPFIAFPNAPVPGLGDDALVPRILLDFLRIAYIPTDTILYGSYLACFVAFPVLVFFFLRPSLGVRGATVGAILIALSPVSYTAFWYMLWKNGWALCLLLGAFIALERRALWWVLALEVAIALSHKTTAIIYIATLCFLFLINRKEWKTYLIHGAVTALAFLAVNTSLPADIVRSSPTAVFLGWSDYLTLSVPFLLLAIAGGYVWKKYQPPQTLFAFMLASILFPLLQLPFYERIFIFSDVALVLLSAFGVEWLLGKITENGWRPASIPFILALCVSVGLLLGNIENQIKTLKPLVSEEQIIRIEEIGARVPKDAILLTTTDEAPWFEGFTQNHIAAPGMLYDNHNLEEWTAFWDSTSTPDRITFLNSFPTPLYISTLGDFADLIGLPIPCLKKIAPSILKNECGSSD